MSERLRRSDTIAKLAEALAKAQGAFKVAEKNATNPFLKNKYADLGSIILASREALSANGLGIIQSPTIEKDDLTITTLLAHSSGEWVESDITLPIGQKQGLTAAQVAGSVITYLRRYGMAALLGIYAGDDDDGNEEVSKPAAPKPAVPKTETAKPAAPATASTRPYTPEQVKAKIEAFVAKTGAPVKLPEKQWFTVVEAVENLFPTSDKKAKETARHSVLFYLVGTTSVKEMTIAQADGIKAWATNNGAVSGEALLEAHAIMLKGSDMLEDIAKKEQSA
jgi:hypothetical protein